MYISHSIIRICMGSKTEETRQLKRYDDNCTAAICSRWIRWEMKNYESGVKSQQLTDWGIRTVWLLSSASRSGSFKIIWGVAHCQMWQTERQKTRCQKQQKWPLMNLATTYTNSYRNQIIRKKIPSMKKWIPPLSPGI